jgi:hypothetical protein
MNFQANQFPALSCVCGSKIQLQFIPLHSGGWCSCQIVAGVNSMAVSKDHGWNVLKTH